MVDRRAGRQVVLCVEPLLGLGDDKGPAVVPLEDLAGARGLAGTFAASALPGETDLHRLAGAVGEAPEDLRGVAVEARTAGDEDPLGPTGPLDGRQESHLLQAA